MKAAGPEYIKVLDSFETQEDLDKVQPGVEYDFLKVSASADTANHATGNQALKLKIGASDTANSLDKVIIGPKDKFDLTNADYLQFYVKNAGKVGIGMLDFGVQAFVVTAENAQYTNAPDFWKDHPGCGYIMGHDQAALPVLLFNSETKAWENAPLAEASLEQGDRDYSRIKFSIPAGYEGYVRVPLSAGEKIESLGIGMCLETRSPDAAGTILSFDDFAAVTTQDMSADKSYNTVQNYFASLNTSYVKVLNGFEAQEDIDNTKTVEFDFLKLVLSPDTVSYGLGNQGLKAKFGSADTANSCTKLMIGGNLDLRNADYVQFYAKNAGKVGVAMIEFGVQAFVVTAENAQYTNAPDFWKDHPGCGYIMNHDRAAAPILLYNSETGTWENAPLAEASLDQGDRDYARVIWSLPAGYEGYVRVPLTEAEKIQSLGIGMTLETRSPDAAGTVISIDDISAVTTQDKSTDSSYLEFNKYKEAVINKGSSGNEDVEKVKVITSFEDSETDVSVTNGINWVPYDFSKSDKYMKTGAVSYKAITNGQPAGMQPYSQYDIEIKKGSDLGSFKNADYLYMWIKNVSKSPAYIGSFTLSNVEAVDYTVETGAQNVSLLKGSQWEAAEVKDNTDALMGAVEIPANYEGFIRIGLADATSLTLNETAVGDIKFFVINTNPKSSFYIDDISIHGTGLSDKAGSLVDPAVYFANCTGGIVDNYDESEYNFGGNSEEPTVTVTPEVPKTGDDFNYYILVVLAIAAGAAMFASRKRAGENNI